MLFPEPARISAGGLFSGDLMPVAARMDKEYKPVLLGSKAEGMVALARDHVELRLARGNDIRFNGEGILSGKASVEL